MKTLSDIRHRCSRRSNLFPALAFRARVVVPRVHEASTFITFSTKNSQESPLSIEDALCRWFPTAASKLTLAAGIVVLAAFIVPG